MESLCDMRLVFVPMVRKAPCIYAASLAKQQSYRSRFRAPATLATVDLSSLSRSCSILPKELRRIFFLTFCRRAQSFNDAVPIMTSDALEADRAMSKPESFLQPLPNLNVVTNVEKLDAGLRGLDHCEHLLQML